MLLSNFLFILFPNLCLVPFMFDRSLKYDHLERDRNINSRRHLAQWSAFNEMFAWRNNLGHEERTPGLLNLPAGAEHKFGGGEERSKYESARHKSCCTLRRKLRGGPVAGCSFFFHHRPK